jgi:hypothetical protein
MKVLGAALIVLALVLAIVPQYTNCDANGHVIKVTAPTPANEAGTTGAAAKVVKVIKMKCLWTARAGIAVAVPLAAVGALMIFSRRKETRRALGITATLLGLITVLLPLTLIGTCLTSTMPCNTEMKPTMLAAGGLTIALGVIALVMNEIKPDDMAGVQPAT